MSWRERSGRRRNDDWGEGTRNGRGRAVSHVGKRRRRATLGARQTSSGSVRKNVLERIDPRIGLRRRTGVERTVSIQKLNGKRILGIRGYKNWGSHSPLWVYPWGSDNADEQVKWWGSIIRLSRGRETIVDNVYRMEFEIGDERICWR
jgi:hypothetical protein